ncbi:MAG: hypothetical protein LUG99_10775 [Lachnospiraceae bacterium]|nr:hypothetical protein [Lachnospiraceae bacterium]
MKFIIISLILIIGIIIYKKADRSNSLTALISGGLITTIVCALLIPSDINLYEIFIEHETSNIESKSGNESNEVENSDLQSDAVNGGLIAKKDDQEETNRNVETENVVQQISDDNLLLLYDFSGSILVEGQEDNYSFNANFTGTYYIALENATENILVNIVLTDENNNVLGETDEAIPVNYGIVVENIDIGDLYTIQVTGVENTGEYKIIVYMIID